MKVECVLPAGGFLEVDEFLADLASVGPVRPFDDDVVRFCSQLSRRLLRDPRTKSHPALVALAFWMRRSELVRLEDEFEAMQGGERMLVPRGLVFHIPPSNVDTMFVYSWMMSLLTGNLNVVRLSSRDTGAAAALRSVIAAELAEHPKVAKRTAMIRYERDDAITGRISAQADVRVVWGGDETVRALQEIPMSLYARQLSFPDRFSFALLDAARYLGVDDAERRELAERFFNDAYWFDQMACSSPSLVVWRGADAQVAGAGTRFFGELAEVAEARGYLVEPGTALGKLAFACRAALDEPVVRHEADGPAVSVLTLESLDRYERSTHGAGTFLNVGVGSLDELERFARRRDQTVTHWGFGASELQELVRTLNGRGVDRVVPVGRALQFGRFWDGYDLLAEFTRSVHVVAPETTA